MNRSGGLAELMGSWAWSLGEALSRCERLVLCAVESSSGQPSPRTGLEPSESHHRHVKNSGALANGKSMSVLFVTYRAGRAPLAPRVAVLPLGLGWGRGGWAREGRAWERAGEAQGGNKGKGPWADLHRVGVDTDPR